MYGLLIESVVEVIKAKYGDSVWDIVRKKAKIDNQVFSTHQQYSETLIQRIVKHLAEATGTNIEAIMDMMGVEFVNFVAQYGYDRILRVLGRHMRDFLNGLDNLHEYMRFSYPKLKPPSFFVEQESASGLILHYRSKRKGFVHYVKGQIRQVGKVFYGLKVEIDIISEVQEMDLQHIVFQLNFDNTQYQAITSSNSTSDLYLNSIGSNLPIRSEIFFELFPFHIVFRRDLEIVSVGESLKTAMKHAEGEAVRDVFNLVRPLMNFNWDNVIGHTNNVFELTTIEPVKRPESPTSSPAKVTSIMSNNFDASNDTTEGHDECLKLRGQMMYIEEWDAIIFLATPVLENLDIMFQTGFYINDLSMHDSSRDLVLVGTQQSAELKLALDQEKQKSKALEDSMKKLDVEMKRTDQLLYQMIPKKIADRLRSGEAVMNLCEVFNNCTILFSDVVGFTSTCSQLSPMEVVSMLNEMYTKFDKCLELHNVYKVETIGDAYMVVSGLPERTTSHAIEIIDMAFDMLAAIATLRNPATGETMMIRIGCHSGPTVAGVVGLKMPRYCLFGDAVNTASRMESTSEAMKIHISQTTKTLIENHPYKISERGKIEVKGKGEMKTYFVLSKLDKNGKPIKNTFADVIENEEKKKKELEMQKALESHEAAVADVSRRSSNHHIENGEDNKSIKSRGYSPVRMEDVARSRASMKDSNVGSHASMHTQSKQSLREDLTTNGHHANGIDPVKGSVRSMKGNLNGSVHGSALAQNGGLGNANSINNNLNSQVKKADLDKSHTSIASVKKNNKPEPEVKAAPNASSKNVNFNSNTNVNGSKQNVDIQIHNIQEQEKQKKQQQQKQESQKQEPPKQESGFYSFSQTKSQEVHSNSDAIIKLASQSVNKQQQQQQQLNLHSTLNLKNDLKETVAVTNSNPSLDKSVKVGLKSMTCQII